MQKGKQADQSGSLSAFLGCMALLILVVGVGMVVLVAQVQSGRESATQGAVQPTQPPLTVTPSLPNTPTPSPTATGTATPPPPTRTIVPTTPPTIRPTILSIVTATAAPLVIPTRPRPAGPTTSAVQIIPDSELVNSPAAIGFDIAAFIDQQPGYIRNYSETVYGRVMSSADSLAFVSINTSVNPRLLLALLEYRGGWLSNPSPAELVYPMGHVGEEYKGLLIQLIWAANQLNTGYYGLKTRGLKGLTLADGTQLAFAPEITAASAAVQFVLAQTAPDRAHWEADVSPEGFAATYRRLFGDPFRLAIDPLVPPDLHQPPLQLPFAPGETWYFSGGPHGGWDRLGSAWGAVDFAPPDPPDALIKAQGKCYVSPYYARAVASGVIVRARDGAVVLDLDMDGDERTGWTILYLHIAIEDRVKVGTFVQPGSPIGHPSCEGFYLNSPGTHVHIARRYNGEWIAADCRACLPGVAAPPFVMSGWTLKGVPGQVSMGYLEAGEDASQAQGTRLKLRDPLSW